MRVVIGVLVVVLVVGTSLFTFSPRSAQAQTLSAGCEFLNNPVFDGSYGTGGGGPFAFAAGEQVTVSADNAEGEDLATFSLEITTPDETLFSESSDIPGTITYTFAEDVSDVTVMWGPAGDFTVSCEAESEPPPSEDTGEGYVQFNHASEVSVTSTERPQLVVQFGNTGSEPLTDVSLSCAITEGDATFTGQVYPGPFTESEASDTTGLEFSGLPTLIVGQNYNVSFGVVPSGSSVVECTLSADNLAPQTASVTVSTR